MRSSSSQERETASGLTADLRAGCATAVDERIVIKRVADNKRPLTAHEQRETQRVGGKAHPKHDGGWAAKEVRYLRIRNKSSERLPTTTFNSGEQNRAPNKANALVGSI